jgi:hypothetical protein
MIKLQSIGLVALAVVATGCFSARVQAEQTPETISDAITSALFNQSGDIYRNTGIDRQATLLFGLSFPDKEALSDAQAVEKLYREGMKAQSGSKVIRTADLPNPFTSSLRTTPAQTKSNYSGDTKSAEAPPEATPESAIMPAKEETAPRGRG